MSFRDVLRRIFSGQSVPVARRGGGSGDLGRDPGDRTVVLPREDPYASAPPQPRPAASPNPHARTVVKPRPRPPAVPQPPVPRDSPPGSEAPPDPDQTVYDKQDGKRKGRIVAVLVGVEGKLEGELYPIFDGENMLGRDPNQFQVRFSQLDLRISRKHAMIIHDEGLFAIKPMNEENATLVNDEKLQSIVELSDGARIYMGRSEFKFHSL